ncbi:MAG: tetratricopeptide repeat protein [Cyanobacteria bacterium P01_H01_bin.15]
MSIQEQQVVAVTSVAGMGGISKTELGVQYADRHKDDYPGGVCWLPMLGQQLAAAIVEFIGGVPEAYRAQPLDRQARWCSENWSPSGSVLLVLDDVTDWRAVEPGLPLDDRFRVMVTTRQQSLGHRELLLDEFPLELEDALDVLRSWLGRKVTFIEKEPEVAEERCEWLGTLPLALTLVGSYLKTKPQRWTLSKMLADLKATTLTQIEAVLELSWDALDNNAQALAMVVGVFEGNAVAWKDVLLLTERLDWAEAQVDSGEEALAQQSLLQISDVLWTDYQVHPLVGAYLRKKLRNSEAPEAYQREYATMLAEVASNMPSALTLSHVAEFESIIPHLEAFTAGPMEFVEDDDLSWLFIGVASFYEGQGLYSIAELSYQAAAKIIPERLGEDHPDTATSYNNLAALYELQGRYEKAEPLFQKALALTQRLLGEDHPSTATSYNNLAVLRLNQKRYQEAEELMLKAVKIKHRILPASHPSLSTSLEWLKFMRS